MSKASQARKARHNLGDRLIGCVQHDCRECKEVRRLLKWALDRDERGSAFTEDVEKWQVAVRRVLRLPCPTCGLQQSPKNSITE